jgi:hypothetical protein
MKSTKIAAFVAAMLATGAFATAAQAETDAATCRTVRFADIGWTDITSTTALASTVFEGLGYKPTTTIASVPISFAGLKSKQLDVSLGYWWPVQQKQLQPFLDNKSINVVEPPNLSGAKATLAVPSYAYQAGLKTFEDIAKHRAELDGKIYGIEPGSSANATIQKMIDTNQYGLGGFKLVESSDPRQEVGGLPGMGTASDEHPDQHELPVRRRCVVRPELWRSTRVHADGARLHLALPQRGQARREPALFDATREPADAVGDEQDEAGRRREGVPEKESAGARCLARRRQDVRRQGRPACREGLSRPVTARAPDACGAQR